MVVNMFKERLNKISTKIFYVIIAIVISAALWMFVEITENEMQDYTLPGIVINLKNEEVLRDRGLLVARVMTENLTITFQGSRSDISRIMVPNAVSVEVDLAGVTSAGAMHLAYVEILPPQVNSNSINITGRSASRITLVVDRILDRQIPVVVNYTGGTASEDLIVEPVEFDPQVIRVTGPEAIISQIDHVYVPILRENLSTTFFEDLPFILVDSDHAELTLDNNTKESVEFSHDTIRVTIPIRQMKDIPLSVALSHGASTSDINTSVSITPQSIKVAGDPDVIRDFNSIALGPIDMLRLELSDTEEFAIIVPNHITNISGELRASVHVEVFRLLRIGYHSTSNIHTVNIPPGYRADIITQSLDVRIRGLEEDLELIGPTNIRVVADLTGIGTGTTRVPARIFIDGIDAAIDAVGDYRIAVTIVAE
jgi:YbbR domain-containing protein